MEVEDGQDQLPPSKRLRLDEDFTQTAHLLQEAIPSPFSARLPDTPYTALAAAATTSNGTLQAREGPQYQLQYTLLGHTKGISAVKISPNGQLLASSGADGFILLYDLVQGTFIKSLTGHSAGLNDIVWTPDGDYIVSASDDHTVRVWDVEQGNCARVLRGHTSCVYCLAINPQGTIVVSGSFDETVRFWDIKTGSTICNLPAHSDPVTAVSFNLNASMLATSSHDGLIRLWDASTSQCLKSLMDESANPPVSHVKFSPNGKFVLSASLDSTLRLWNYFQNDQKPVKTYSGHTNAKYSISPLFVMWKKMALVVCGSEDGWIWVWDVQSTKEVGAWKAHDDTVVAVDVKDGHLVSASLEKDLSVKVWKLID